jgi:Schlafen, AlbA_2
MTDRISTEADLQGFISTGAEESLTLEYKAADALGKSDGKKKEITKDISAIANSAGGVLIYGIKEYDDPAKRHLPARVDPIDRATYPKEWLEQITSTIRPRIDSLIIEPVPIGLDQSKCVYVVRIPQSDTAHQASDFRYYKRYNFESIPMYDYKIRDVMGRSTHLRITLSFQIELETREQEKLIPRSGIHTEYVDAGRLQVIARNEGRVYAQYINAFVRIPAKMLLPEVVKQKIIIDGCCEFSTDNTIRDVVDVQVMAGGTIPKYGP